MLSTVEYNHLMRNWSVLKDQVKEMERQEVFHEKKYKECEDRKDLLIEAEKFYTGDCKELFDEYEATHPPEDI